MFGNFPMNHNYERLLVKTSGLFLCIESKMQFTDPDISQVYYTQKVKILVQKNLNARGKSSLQNLK